ncbi:MAG: DUF3347 domain-containing protein [Candidatus Synoicihabitans palmerolidicus]|nr:DUF3347 domain-containing protein [Candidatus Synoicihabitans palmerolidicus]
MKTLFNRLLISITVFTGLVLSTLAHAAEIHPAFVDSLVPNYLKVQTALASDDLAAASVKSLTESAQKVASAPDIKAARASFAQTSIQLMALVAEVGTTNAQPLYIAHCTMAFGQGADWLQADTTVNNPFYGSMMLRCGSIKCKSRAPSLNSPLAPTWPRTPLSYPL